MSYGMQQSSKVLYVMVFLMLSLIGSEISADKGKRWRFCLWRAATSYLQGLSLLFNGLCCGLYSCLMCLWACEGMRGIVCFLGLKTGKIWKWGNVLLWMYVCEPVTVRGWEELFVFWAGRWQKSGGKISSSASARNWKEVPRRASDVIKQKKSRNSLILSLR